MKDLKKLDNGKKESFAARWVGSGAVFVGALYLILNGGAFIFIDYLNLLIHEGGHGIFRLFGQFIYVLGGTLMQIIIPGMFVVFYFVKKKRVPVQIFLLWLGQNLLNISVYAADARLQRLPLFGGKKVKHDWNYILSQIGLLDYDYMAGYFFFTLALIAFLIALFIPVIIKNYNPLPIELNL